MASTLAQLVVVCAFQSVGGWLAGLWLMWVEEAGRVRTRSQRATPLRAPPLMPGHAELMCPCPNPPPLQLSLAVLAQQPGYEPTQGTPDLRRAQVGCGGAPLTVPATPFTKPTDHHACGVRQRSHVCPGPFFSHTLLCSLTHSCAQAPENTVTYLFTLAQYLALALVFNKGRPHRSPLFTNLSLLTALSLQVGRPGTGGIMGVAWLSWCARWCVHVFTQGRQERGSSGRPHQLSRPAPRSCVQVAFLLYSLFVPQSYFNTEVQQLVDDSGVVDMRFRWASGIHGSCCAAHEERGKEGPPVRTLCCARV